MLKSLLQEQRWPKLAGTRLRVLGCVGAKCRHFTVSHSWVRKDGIFLDGAWLCGPQCFEAAVILRLSSRMPGEPGTLQRAPRMPFQLLLLQSGVLSEQALQNARQLADSRGISLGEALLAVDAVSEEQLAAARAGESGCALYSLPPQPIAPELMLPSALASKALAATVHGTAERLVIGFTERLDRGVLAMTEQVTGQRAEGCFITASRWKAQLAIDSAGQHFETPAAQPLPVGMAARIILEKASQVRAEQVVFGRAGNLVWIRYGRCDKFFENSLLCVPR